MLNVIKIYMGLVLFFEEDYYVSLDFYYMLRLLYDGKMRLVYCNKDFLIYDFLVLFVSLLINYIFKIKIK